MSHHVRHAGAVRLLLQALPPGVVLEQVPKPPGGTALECWITLAITDMACMLGWQSAGGHDAYCA